MQVTETSATAHVFDAIFSPGDEILSGLTDLARKHNITSGYVTGLGGLSGALLGFGDPELGAFAKDRRRREMRARLVDRPHPVARRRAVRAPARHRRAQGRQHESRARVRAARGAARRDLVRRDVDRRRTSGCREARRACGSSRARCWLAAAAPAFAQSADRAADEAAVRAVIQAFLDTREKNDAAGLAALLTADVDQQPDLGQHAQRPRRRRARARSRRSRARAAGARSRVDSLRFVGADVAIADGRYDSVGRADGTDQRMLTSMVLRREGGAWKIAAIRNMLPTQP